MQTKIFYLNKTTGGDKNQALAPRQIQESKLRTRSSPTKMVQAEGLQQRRYFQLLGSAHRASPAAQWLRIHLQCRSRRRWGLNPWVRKIPWRTARQHTPVFLPGESHGQSCLQGYIPWVLKELDWIDLASIDTCQLIGHIFLLLLHAPIHDFPWGHWAGHNAIIFLLILCY